MTVPPSIQYLRCLANYEALQFSSSISHMAKKLVERMTEMSSRSGGKYVSIHLRFEEVIKLVFQTVKFLVHLMFDGQENLINRLSSSCRTWWHSHAVYMMEEKLKKWK